jgi:hypothetical protein
MCSPNFLSFSINKAKVKFATINNLDLSPYQSTSIVYESNNQSSLIKFQHHAKILIKEG